MTALAVIAAMLATGVAGRPRLVGRDRLTAVVATPHATAPNSPSGSPSFRTWWRAPVAVVVALGAIAALGGAVGVGCGLAGAAVILLVRARDGAQPAIDPDDVPVVVDLLAGCLAAGASMPDALDAAAMAAGEALRCRCRTVAADLRTGAPAAQAWNAWLADPWLAPVARTAVRTSRSGAAAAADLRRTAIRLRSRRRAAAQHRVRQASVWLVAPLGLCFLPAFILVAVVPLVVGLLPTLR